MVTMATDWGVGGGGGVGGDVGEGEGCWMMFFFF